MSVPFVRLCPSVSVSVGLFLCFFCSWCYCRFEQKNNELISGKIVSVVGSRMCGAVRRVLWLKGVPLEVACSLCVVWSMADLDEQLPLEGFVKILIYLGVEYYRCLRLCLTLSKR